MTTQIQPLRMDMQIVKLIKGLNDFTNREGFNFYNDPPESDVKLMLNSILNYNLLIKCKNHFENLIDNPAASQQDQIDANSYMKMLNPILTRFQVYRQENPNNFNGGKSRRRRTKKTCRGKSKRRGRRGRKTRGRGIRR